MNLREEIPSDVAKIRNLLSTSFPTTAEADLVEMLRSRLSSYISLVCTHKDQIVGHILFTPVTIAHNPEQLPACGLAPMAVLPDFQNMGIGSKLVREGLEASKTRRYDLVVVLGHADYYPRFGFQPAIQFGLNSEYDVPDNAFMAQELAPNTLSKVSGTVSYHRLFNSV